MPIFERNKLPTSRCAQQGVTLIELLIALSILSLGALIAASAMNRALPQRTLDLTAEQLVSDLKRARLEAQKSGKPVALLIAEDGYVVTGIIDRRLSNAITAGTDAESGEIIFQKSFANLGGAVVLSKGERRAIIAVRPITGKIERVE